MILLYIYTHVDTHICTYIYIYIHLFIYICREGEIRESKGAREIEIDKESESEHPQVEPTGARLIGESDFHVA